MRVATVSLHILEQLGGDIGSRWKLQQVVTMASEIEGDVKKTLLDRTDAEKVFRPWWDTVEDFILNISIGLGEYFYILWSITI